MHHIRHKAIILLDDEGNEIIMPRDMQIPSDFFRKGDNVRGVIEKVEMIGIKPKPLALSLYKKLITDQIWSKQRKDYGYKNVSSNYLMASFFGTPYIDVRVDFNSWIPKNLNQDIAKKLTNFYN